MGNWVWPLPGYSRISSPFGPRNCPFHGRETHTGTDLPAPYGTKILAARPGTVTNAKMTSGYGNLVIISHGNGIQTYYAHCSSILVRSGSKVSAGQVIARVGSTGPSTGNHLHFGVKVNGSFRNPMSYVSPSDTASRYTGPSGGSDSASQAETNESLSAAVGQGENTKEITVVKTVSTVGKVGTHDSSLASQGSVQNTGYELLMQHGSQIYQPEVEGAVTLEYARKDAPGKMQFTVYKDAILKIAEGDPVRFRVDGKNTFFGYVFTFARKATDLYSITAYDQLRYLTNKDVMSYKKKTYSQVLKMIAKQYKLSCGSIANTKYVIGRRLEEGTLMDILANAANITHKHTKKTYALYDDFGKLTLKDSSKMKLPILIDMDTMEDFDYSSSIDSNSYNRIKLYRDNEKSGVREAFVRNGTAKQKQWGILQYTSKATGNSKAEIKQEAKKLLSKYQKISRSLSIKNCLGDRRVRGGSSIMVMLNLGDKSLSEYMQVEEVVHTFEAGHHFMDLKLSGGAFAV